MEKDPAMRDLIKSAPITSTLLACAVTALSYFTVTNVIRERGPHVIVFSGKSTTPEVKPDGEWVLEWDAQVLRHDCQSEIHAFYSGVDEVSGKKRFYSVHSRSLGARKTDGARRHVQVPLRVPNEIVPGRYEYVSTILSRCEDGTYVTNNPPVLVTVGPK